MFNVTATKTKIKQRRIIYRGESGAEFYKKIEFRPNKDVFLSIPCKWF